MADAFLLETERLLLRPWKDEDLDPFADMCADPEVMRFFPDIWTRKRSALMISRSGTQLTTEGFFLSAVEVKATGEFIGFVGLNRPTYAKPLPFDPCVEIGWRLKRSAWGQGYAGEAAAEWLRFGFETVGLEEIVSFTIPANLPSQRVMEKIGMIRDWQGDFLHPTLPADHPYARHVLYRLNKTDWQIRAN
jgi:ribosomal-protein-alanine N-acetyltransferase